MKKFVGNQLSKNEKRNTLGSNDSDRVIKIYVDHNGNYYDGNGNPIKNPGAGNGYIIELLPN